MNNTSHSERETRYAFKRLGSYPPPITGKTWLSWQWLCFTISCRDDSRWRRRKRLMDSRWNSKVAGFPDPFKCFSLTTRGRLPLDEDSRTLSIMQTHRQSRKEEGFWTWCWQKVFLCRWILFTRERNEISSLIPNASSLFFAINDTSHVRFFTLNDFMNDRCCYCRKRSPSRTFLRYQDMTQCEDETMHHRDNFVQNSCRLFRLRIEGSSAFILSFSSQVEFASLETSCSYFCVVSQSRVFVLINIFMPSNEMIRLHNETDKG